MKQIRILHLFPKRLCLYGEYGNVAVLARTLETLGNNVEVISYEDGTLSFEDVDMVYVGAGTEDAIWEANRLLQPHKQIIKNAVADGISFLATGNAMALFGSELTYDGVAAAALEIYSYKTEMSSKKRHLADALGKDTDGNIYVGFINTGCVYIGTDKPVMELLLGKKLGNDKVTPAEGYREGSFFATQLIGPVLTKNPHLLSTFVKKLTGEEYTIDPNSNLQKAYEIAKQELLNRLNG